MKTLLLVRHAKATRDDAALPDRERPLAERGRHDAVHMGKRLAARGVRPDLIVSSPAVRALATAQLIAHELGHDRKAIVIDDRLYAASISGLLAVVQSLDKKCECVMLFGHNPEFSGLANTLSSDIAGMPTCAVAEFRYRTGAWTDVGALAPSKVLLDVPDD